jgi:septum formation protein
MTGARRLILASTSRYRAMLLARLDVPFDAAAPVFDESAYEYRFESSTDETFALELARGKALSLAPAFEGAFILAADQIAVLPGPPRRLLHKPGTQPDAIEQLMSLAGKTHALTTGVVLLDAATGERHETVDRHRLTMRAFDRAEAEAYVQRHRPLDCVGAYRIEDAGVRLFERFDAQGADFTGIIGLPMLSVCRLLRSVRLIP